MEQYLNLLREVMTDGIWKEPAREGMPRTKELFCRTMRFDLSKGFPLLTTKKMFTKGIVGELIWFLRGDTNIRYLVNNGIHIWDDDTFKYYKRFGGKKDKEEFINEVKDNPYTSVGNCGHIYGWQWRTWGTHFDQIQNLIDGLKKNKNSRYHVVTAWNPSDFLTSQYKAALPACHMMFQCSVREGKLDLMMLQRSCDMFLGVPFNIASYALLTHILAVEVGLEPGEFVWVGNSVHLYENHFEQAKEQLTRLPFKLCKLEFIPRSISDYEISDFKFVDYESHPAIKAPLSVGV